MDRVVEVEEQRAVQSEALTSALDAALAAKNEIGISQRAALRAWSSAEDAARLALLEGIGEMKATLGTGMYPDLTVLRKRIEEALGKGKRD